ncbi:hypothetical protein ACTXNC_13270, partial [Psychrobacter celer]
KSANKTMEGFRAAQMVMGASVVNSMQGIFNNNKASEDYAKELGRRIGKDLGKKGKRKFHDKKPSGSPDRTKDELRDDAQDTYEDMGHPIPDWLKD